MWDDPVVREIRKIRDEHAARFSFNLQAIADDLVKQQDNSGKTFVLLQPKKPTPLPKMKTPKDMQ